MKRSSTVRALMLAATAALAAAVPASAVTTVTTVNGANWQIHDIAPPKLDTGSIRAISDNAFYGFGGIRVRVSGVPASDPSARLNGELMRGFGLAFDGEDAFKTAAPIVLGGVAISRDIKLSKPGNWTRWIDTFANTTQRTITLDVAFGGSAGQNSGSNQSIVQSTSSGDALIGADDTWVQAANPAANGASSRGPHAAVLGTQQGSGNFQRDPFGTPAAGHGPGGQLLRLQEHAHARPGPDEVAAALRRRRPRRDRRHRGRAEHDRQERRRPRWPRRPT